MYKIPITRIVDNPLNHAYGNRFSIGGISPGLDDLVNKGTELAWLSVRRVRLNLSRYTWEETHT